MTLSTREVRQQLCILYNLHKEAETHYKEICDKVDTLGTEIQKLDFIEQPARLANLRVALLECGEAQQHTNKITNVFSQLMMQYLTAHNGSIKHLAKDLYSTPLEQQTFMDQMCNSLGERKTRSMSSSS